MSFDFENENLKAYGEFQSGSWASRAFRTKSPTLGLISTILNIVRELDMGLDKQINEDGLVDAVQELAHRVKIIPDLLIEPKVNYLTDTLSRVSNLKDVNKLVAAINDDGLSWEEYRYEKFTELKAARVKSTPNPFRRTATDFNAVNILQGSDAVTQTSSPIPSSTPAPES